MFFAAMANRVRPSAVLRTVITSEQTRKAPQQILRERGLHNVRLVHLLHTYSNTPDLLTGLQTVTLAVHRADLQDEPTLPSTTRAWRLHDRLTEAQMDEIVKRYDSEVSVTTLMGAAGSVVDGLGAGSRRWVSTPVPWAVEES